MNQNQVHFSISPVGKGEARLVKAYVGTDKVMEVKAANEQEARLLARSWKAQTQKVLRKTSVDLNRTASKMRITEGRGREEKML